MPGADCSIPKIVAIVGNPGDGGDRTYRADWREAYALFPGDVAYIWHGALRGDVVAAGLAACGFQLRAQIVWAKPLWLPTRILRSIDLRKQSGGSHQSLGSAVSIGTTFGWHNRH